MRIKIRRKEAKESVLWLKLIINTNPSQFLPEGEDLIQEANELKKIFSSMIQK